MLNILVNKELNSRNFFLAVNLAYDLTIGLDIKKTKILLYHVHHIAKLEDFKEDFPDFDVICGIREPRNGLVSSVDHWKEYLSTSYNSSILYQFINRIFEESEPVLQYTKNCKTSKLENLHLSPQEVLEEFCATYGLKLEDSMFESSYHGKKWWGDTLSGRYLDGFNKNINDKKWKGKLFFYDNFLIEFILEDRLRHYGYPIENKMSKLYLFFVVFLIFLPMKYELKVFAYNFRKGQTAKGRGSVSAVYKAIYFYLRRVCLYFIFVWKKFRKKIFLAQFFAQEKTLK